MKIDVLGTSCTWFKRNDTSFLIDDHIVFDTPTGAYKEIIKRIGIEKISTFIISHFHLDHFGDFRTFATRYMREFKNLEVKKKVYAPKGCLEYMIETNKMFFCGEDELDAEGFLNSIEFIELYDGFEFELEDYIVTTFKVVHSNMDCFAFKFKEKKTGKVVAFSADTEMCDNVHNLLKHANVAFVELSSPQKRKNHICIEEFEMLIKQYDKCIIYPVHTCDKCQEYVEQNKLNPLQDGQILNI